MSQQFSLDPAAARRHASVLKGAAGAIRSEGSKVTGSLDGLMSTFKGKQAPTFDAQCRASAKQLASIAQQLDDLSRQVTALAAKVEGL